MTIISPKNNKTTFNLVLIGLVLALVVLAYWSISVYNQTVNLRHALTGAEEQLQDLEVANADIKNQLYQLTDSSRLINFGEERGLVKARALQYIQLWSAETVSKL